LGAARRGLATLPGHEASRRLRAIGYHDGLEAREPKQTKQHGEELAAASILHAPIVIGARSHPKRSPDQPRVASRAARHLRSHQAKVLSSMNKQPAHTNHCGFCAVAARCADAKMSSSCPANSIPVQGQGLGVLRRAGKGTVGSADQAKLTRTGSMSAVAVTTAKTTGGVAIFLGQWAM
jgi:hypothetical protein